MKHNHMHRHGGPSRHFASPDGRREGHHQPGPFRGRRPFDYGALRLLVLDMITERPRHGYELIKAIEERTGGGYSPSPGVIYPTLSWLEDMGYAAAEAEGGRRSYRITPEGEAFIAANPAALAELTARMGAPGGRRHAPEPVLKSMDRLKRALRARFASGPVDPAALAAIAAAIDTAAQTVETSMTESRAETPDTPLVRSTARVRTDKAAGYLAQLCKHFAHKIPATHEGNSGRISFTRGDCHLSAEGDVLVLTVESREPDAIPALQDVVARHLERFSFREPLAISWDPA